ncbi:MAG: diguanylate cyclase [Moraxellaceae bacterium]|jgi:diguanylate cyclase (GGDEF)-like protein|nr:diguanylate cyclase [Moraxellaceae bacterium]
MEPNDTSLLQQQLDNRGWRLQFPQALETEFQRDFALRYRTHMQLAMLLGCFALLACGVIDPFWMPEAAGRLWTVRLFVVTPMLALLLLSRGSLGERHMQLIAALASCLAVAGLVGLSINAAEPFNHYYSSAISMVMLVVFVLSRMQFNWGVASAVIMLMTLNVGLFAFSSADLKIITINNFVFFASAAFALVGTFLIERSLRQNYLQSRLLSIQNTDLEGSNLRLQYLTAIDGLTQIANRRSLDMTLTTEWQRALRKREPIGVVMIDVDHFKLFNDTYGHAAGDECLRGVAGALKDFARRPGDLAARYGGEEFVLVLTNATAQQAQIVAERVRDKIVELAIPHQCSSHGSVTASFGVASMVPGADQTGPEALLLAADQALYRAKESGRNRVSVSASGTDSQAVA